MEKCRKVCWGVGKVKKVWGCGKVLAVGKEWESVLGCGEGIGRCGG